MALGGGHGLAGTLRALLGVNVDPTAIVSVADDGGSSGRIREEFGMLPPGDLRMALAALCPDPEWTRLLQARFPGDGSLAGHSVGNVMIAGAWQGFQNPVNGLAWLGGALGARGRVLPLSSVPLTIHAEVRDSNGSVRSIEGQHRVATAVGLVERIWLEPGAPPAAPESVQAIADADCVIMGPGSWFTSVLPHLIVPEIRDALVATPARRILITNVRPRVDQETHGLGVDEHVRILLRHAPGLRFDAILVDPAHLDDPEALASVAAECGATIVAQDVESSDAPGTHDPALLGRALATMLPA